LEIQETTLTGLWNITQPHSEELQWRTMDDGKEEMTTHNASTSPNIADFSAILLEPMRIRTYIAAFVAIPNEEDVLLFMH